MFFRDLNLTPKLLTMLRTYSLKQFGDDAAAGVIVGIVALPLAIAFAIASGVSPEKGCLQRLSGVHTEPLLALEQAGIINILGEENVFLGIDEALGRAREIANGTVDPHPSA